jgi:hypothetical protein
MIYLDTSVALAHLLSEDRRPADALWSETIVASRLLEYELWTRIHARAFRARARTRSWDVGVGRRERARTRARVRE